MDEVSESFYPLRKIDAVAVEWSIKCSGPNEHSGKIVTQLYQKSIFETKFTCCNVYVIPNFRSDSSEKK